MSFFDDPVCYILQEAGCDCRLTAIELHGHDFAKLLRELPAEGFDFVGIAFK